MSRFTQLSASAAGSLGSPSRLQTHASTQLAPASLATPMLPSRAPLLSARSRVELHSPTGCHAPHGRARLSQGNLAHHLQPGGGSWVTRAAATSGVELSTSSGTVEGDLVQGKEPSSVVARAVQESLQVLEWPSVCQQVACFSQTVMGASQLAAGGLPIGGTRRESEQLLQETSEAQRANLDLRRVFDLSSALDTACRDNVLLNAKQLEGVGKSIQAALAAKERILSDADGSGPEFPALAELVRGISDEEYKLIKAIQTCIQYGSVTDSASAELHAVRQQRNENKEKLRELMDEIVKDVHKRGGCESRSHNVIRDRLCIGVKAGAQSMLPKGSIKLGQSQTGATLYYEPKTVVTFNNNEAMLQEEEIKQEQMVLLSLTKMLAGRATHVTSLLKCVTNLDIATARGAHASWINGVRPRFLSWEEVESGVVPMQLAAATHPLLLQRALPPLPSPPSVDDNNFHRNFAEPPAWEPRRSVLGTAPPMAGASAESSQGTEDGNSGPVKRPSGLELCVPGSRRVVCITGPNTGGKTVTLKTVGLLTTMAKAGMYIPVQGEDASLVWPDQVLADIGDAQDLQQNLSTFSGHVRRIKQILAAVTPHSLVLLDEVGSGTDPLEGAALARAILDKLAVTSGLTFATSHHAELKTAPDEDPRYINVSMGFNISSLRPTYQLNWGSAGDSNALDIATAFGFDSTVVQAARETARANMLLEKDRIEHRKAVAESLQYQLVETKEEIARREVVNEQRRQMAEEVRMVMDQLVQLKKALKASPMAIIQERDAIRSDILKAVNSFLVGDIDKEMVRAEFERLEARIPKRVALFMGKHYAGGIDGEADPSRGDIVLIKKYGNMGEAVVVGVSGQSLRLRVLNTQLGVLCTLFNNRGGEYLRAEKSEVQLIKRRADVTPADLGYKEEEEEENMFDADSPASREYQEVMKQVQAVMYAPSRKPASPESVSRKNVSEAMTQEGAGEADMGTAATSTEGEGEAQHTGWTSSDEETSSVDDDFSDYDSAADSDHDAAGGEEEFLNQDLDDDEGEGCLEVDLSDMSVDSAARLAINAISVCPPGGSVELVWHSEASFEDDSEGTSEETISIDMLQSPQTPLWAKDELGSILKKLLDKAQGRGMVEYIQGHVTDGQVSVVVQIAEFQE